MTDIISFIKLTYKNRIG